MRNIFVFLLLTTALFGGGYRIPETSLNAVALGAANVAHISGADAAYYNPANMAFMKNEALIELGVIYIGLNNVNYQGSYTSASGATTSGHNINATREDFFIPTLHYVSQGIDGVRLGVSLVTPAGLSKRWQDAPAVYSSEEFTLKTIELNPSIAYRISDTLGAAFGLRAIYTDGVVKSTSPISSRDMSGDSVDFGYNLALSYKPTSELEFALTYRSRVDLTSKGDATLFYRDMTNAFGGGAGATYSSFSSASVSVPVPAILNIAAAYTFPSKTTLEFVYERNYWSAYEELDFNYGSGVDPVTNIVFGNPVAKNFKDTDAFRFGVTQELDALRLMGGVVIDKTPVPNETIGFELPDSDSLSLSLGTRYQITQKINIGLAALYSMREDRRVSNASLQGEYSDANVLIVSSAVEYKF
ncbi:MAG: outer membrane protein transport protein [Sulfurimonas sp.]|uniref:OmpP1/FadL family transporter n=1 Tax=Sulfurimonas sp. TaxID=2022749 RepID=UPI00262ADA11|nr:outer membrane protein transport protein [Sulfurimonas sp.]MDD3475502.1 outer membrane protein transport protein [Sulfurimonas sp.]